MLVKREPTNSKGNNRGAGYGLEVPCVYRLYGPKVYVKRMTEELSARNLTSLASYLMHNTGGCGFGVRVGRCSHVVECPMLVSLP